MPPVDYMPFADADFHSWQGNFVTCVLNNYVALGLTLADNAALSAAQAPWKGAYPAHVTAAAAAIAARQAKDDARETLVGVIRPRRLSPTRSAGRLGSRFVSRVAGEGGAGGRRRLARLSPST